MNVRDKIKNSKRRLRILDLGLEMIAPVCGKYNKNRSTPTVQSGNIFISKMLYAVRGFLKKIFSCDSGHEISQNPDYLECYRRKIAKTGKK